MYIYIYIMYILYIIYIICFIYAYIYMLYICIYVYIRVNNNDLTATSLQAMVFIGESSSNGPTIHLLAGVRPAHGKMGGPTIQVSEIL